MPTDDESILDQTTRTTQIIIGALTVGLLAFLVIVLVNPKPPANVRQGPPKMGVASVPLFTGIAFVFAAGALTASVVVPKSVVATQRRLIAKGTGDGVSSTSAGDTGKLAQVFSTQLIIGAALNEGAAFFALMAYMFEHNPASLYLAIVLIAGVALRFPTRDRVGQWMDTQLSLLAQERQFGS
jgi:hypothetical protein